MSWPWGAESAPGVGLEMLVGGHRPAPSMSRTSIMSQDTSEFGCRDERDQTCNTQAPGPTSPPHTSTPGWVQGDVRVHCTPKPALPWGGLAHPLPPRSPQHHSRTQGTRGDKGRDNPVVAPHHHHCAHPPAQEGTRHCWGAPGLIPGHHFHPHRKGHVGVATQGVSKLLSAPRGQHPWETWEPAGGSLVSQPC